MTEQLEAFVKIAEIRKGVEIKRHRYGGDAPNVYADDWTIRADGIYGASTVEGILVRARTLREAIGAFMEAHRKALSDANRKATEALRELENL
jgi:hypothetical protein